MSARALLLVGIAAAAGIAVIALSGKSSASTPSRGVGGTLPPNPSPATSPGSCPPNPAPAVHVVTNAQNGVSFPLRTEDVLRTELLITQQGYDWAVRSSDPSVLYSDTHTTGPDQATGGTNAVDVWVTQGRVGTVTLTGQLVPRGGGASVATWTMVVPVVCG